MTQSAFLKQIDGASPEAADKLRTTYRKEQTRRERGESFLFSPEEQKKHAFSLSPAESPDLQEAGSWAQGPSVAQATIRDSQWNVLRTEKRLAPIGWEQAFCKKHGLDVPTWNRQELLVPQSPVPPSQSAVDALNAEANGTHPLVEGMTSEGVLTPEGQVPEKADYSAAPWPAGKSDWNDITEVLRNPQHVRKLFPGLYESGILAPQEMNRRGMKFAGALSYWQELKVWARALKAHSSRGFTAIKSQVYSRAGAFRKTTIDLLPSEYVARIPKLREAHYLSTRLTGLMPTKDMTPQTFRAVGVPASPELCADIIEPLFGQVKIPPGHELHSGNSEEPETARDGGTFMIVPDRQKRESPLSKLCENFMSAAFGELGQRPVRNQGGFDVLASEIALGLTELERCQTRMGFGIRPPFKSYVPESPDWLYSEAQVRVQNFPESPIFAGKGMARKITASEVRQRLRGNDSRIADFLRGMARVAEKGTPALLMPLGDFVKAGRRIGGAREVVVSQTPVQGEVEEYRTVTDTYGADFDDIAQTPGEEPIYGRHVGEAYQARTPERTIYCPEPQYEIPFSTQSIWHLKGDAETGQLPNELLDVVRDGYTDADVFGPVDLAERLSEGVAKKRQSIDLFSGEKSEEAWAQEIENQIQEGEDLLDHVSPAVREQITESESQGTIPEGSPAAAVLSGFVRFSGDAATAKARGQELKPFEGLQMLPSTRKNLGSLFAAGLRSHLSGLFFGKGYHHSGTSLRPQIIDERRGTLSSFVTPIRSSRATGADDDGDITTGTAAIMPVECPEGKVHVLVEMRCRFPQETVPSFVPLPPGYKSDLLPESEEKQRLARKLISCYEPIFEEEEWFKYRRGEQAVLFPSGARASIDGDGARARQSVGKYEQDTNPQSMTAMCRRKANLDQTGQLTRQLERLSDLQAYAHTRSTEEWRVVQEKLEEKKETVAFGLEDQLVGFKKPRPIKPAPRCEVREAGFDPFGLSEDPYATDLLPLGYHARIDQIRRIFSSDEDYVSSSETVEGVLEQARDRSAFGTDKSRSRQLLQSAALTCAKDLLEGFERIETSAKPFMDDLRRLDKSQAEESEVARLKQAMNAWRREWSEFIDRRDRAIQRAPASEEKRIIEEYRTRRGHKSRGLREEMRSIAEGCHAHSIRKAVLEDWTKQYSSSKTRLERLKAEDFWRWKGNQNGDNSPSEQAYSEISTAAGEALCQARLGEILPLGPKRYDSSSDRESTVIYTKGKDFPREGESVRVKLKASGSGQLYGQLQLRGENEDLEEDLPVFRVFTTEEADLPSEALLIPTRRRRAVLRWREED